MTEKEKEINTSSLHWFTPQIVAVAGLGRADTRSIWGGWQKPRYLGHHLFTFLIASAGSWI